MNSIILTHVATSAQGGFLLDAALDRLGAWIDAELGSLEELLAISGCGDAKSGIKTLRGLHLEAAATQTETRRLLEDAQESLECLMASVRTISSEALVNVRAPSDFDAWVRWSGARLQDIQITLSRALEA
ncbi:MULTISPECIES: hypothetical protein [unclassified Mameliella]|uniref:hypothetical protein n=1 Tax=unclassified Mameliella TaxID=2630630 RepID=UPI00273F1F35|nr:MULTISPECIES: hypothetical protein [unclassified Mameliella]